MFGGGIVVLIRLDLTDVLGYWDFMSEQRCLAFRRVYDLCKVQFLAYRVDWVAIGIYLISFLATFMVNF